MEYSIRELSDLAGVSARTLRYYGEIGLLQPLYTNDAGYRFYGEDEVAVLQQILFYRERGFDLKRIRDILYHGDFDIMNALEEHLLDLEEERERMDSLIRTVSQTILSMKGEYKMSNEEKFEAFKEKMVKENEEKYGAEIREKCGDEEIDASNRKMLNMSREEWERMESLGSQIKELLKEGVLTGMKADSEQAKAIVELHKEWLCMTWRQYTPEAHQSLALTYVADDRFRAYYDSEITGCAKLLEQAISCWAGKAKE